MQTFDEYSDALLDEAVEDIIRSYSREHEQEYIIRELFRRYLEEDRMRALALLKRLIYRSPRSMSEERTDIDIILEVREHFDPRSRAFIINELLEDLEEPDTASLVARLERLNGSSTAADFICAYWELDEPQQEIVRKELMIALDEAPFYANVRDAKART